MCSSVGGLFVTTLGTTQTPVWRAGEPSPVQAMPCSPRMLGYSSGRATKESRYGNIPGGEYGMDDVECKVGHISQGSAGPRSPLRSPKKSDPRSPFK